MSKKGEITVGILIMTYKILVIFHSVVMQCNTCNT